MGAIQGSINNMIGSVAIGIGGVKHIGQQAVNNKQQAELIEQGRKTQESIKNMITPSQFVSAAVKTYDQGKQMEALQTVTLNSAAKYAQQEQFKKLLEGSKGKVRASRKTIGGKK
jgi:hypothetical protein